MTKYQKSEQLSSASSIIRVIECFHTRQAVQYISFKTTLISKESMTTIQEFRCEICGTITSNPLNWYVIQCGNSELTVLKWTAAAANAPGARHFCGEAHAQVYISRWFESVCSPPKPDYGRAQAT
jgi:hypothetical protein